MSSASASPAVAAGAASAQPPNPALNPPPFIYKFTSESEWAATYGATGKYCGSPLDIKDGFIHASDKESTPRTAELYFPNERNLLLVQLKVPELVAGGKFKWDWVESRKTYFPHLYALENGFQKAHIEAVHKCPYDEEKKRHVLPELQ